MALEMPECLLFDRNDSNARFSELNRFVQQLPQIQPFTTPKSFSIYPSAIFPTNPL